MGSKTPKAVGFMLAKQKILLSGSSNIMPGMLVRRRQIGLGRLLHEKRSRRDRRPAGSNAKSKNPGENGSGGCGVMRLEMRQLAGATRRREGYGRFHYLDNAKFCSNARGSCWEVLDHLITAADEKILSDELLVRGRELVGHAVRLLNGYMNYLKRTQSSPPNNK
jgi:hypothetical protein